MKVLHIVRHLHKLSGVSVYSSGLCDALAKGGADVAIGVANMVDANRLESDCGVSRVQADGLFANKGDWDVVHIHNLWTPDLHRAAVWTRRFNVPVVWSLHGTLSPWSFKYKWWKKCLPWYLYQKRDLKSAAVLHVTSEGEDRWVRDAGFGDQRIVNIPMGTEIRPAIARRHDIHRILFVGRIAPVKSLEKLIQAWAKVDRANWRLRIVGVEDFVGYTDSLKALCKQLGVVDSVEFVGQKFGQDLEDEYAQADALALVSETENFGAVVADALAWGLPVITSKGTPWREVEGGREVVVGSGSGTVEESEGRGARSTVEFEIVRGEEAPFCKTAEALAWARLHGLIGRMGENETGGKGVVTISAESIRETLNPRQREKSVSQSVHFAALMKLRELIRASRILEVHPDWLKDSSGKRSPAVGVNHDIAICVAYAAFGIGDVVYRVRLTLKRYRQTKSSKVYAYRVNEIEVVPGTLGGKIALTTNPTGTTSICGTILLNGALDVNGVPLLAGDEGESEVVVGSGSGTMKRSASNTQTLKHSNNSSRCGWWVSNDPETLAKTLREAMSLSDEERQAMGARGRELVREKYSWVAVADQMKEVYESLIRR